jgi:DinB family protein
MGAVTDLLARELVDGYETVRTRVQGLTDEEFFWEPVPDCWTVRPAEHGRWAADYEEPDPDPAPFTTIAWRLVHVAECKLMYHEYAFGPARPTWPELDSPRTAVDAIAALEHGQALLLGDIAGLEDGELDRSVLTNWGERWPAWRIFWTMIQHDLHHGAEIGTLRDLYRVRQA